MRPMTCIQPTSVRATRLRSCVKSDDLVGRSGGDEFTVLLPHMPSIDTAGPVAQKIIEAIRPFFGKDPLILTRGTRVLLDANGVEVRGSWDVAGTGGQIGTKGFKINPHGTTASAANCRSSHHASGWNQNSARFSSASHCTSESRRRTCAFDS